MRWIDSGQEGDRFSQTEIERRYLADRWAGATDDAHAASSIKHGDAAGVEQSGFLAARWNAQRVDGLMLNHPRRKVVGVPAV